MTAMVRLPAPLRRQLASLSRRLRLLRAVRGLSWLVLVLAVTAGAALLADFALPSGLPPLVRLVNLCLWYSLGAATLLFALLRPLLRPLRSADLAAAVEEQFPQLDERLTTAVEVSANHAGGNGSRAFIDLLVAETAVRSQQLPFARAASCRSAGWLATLAAVAVAVPAAPAIVFSADYGRLAQRFLFPWQVPVVEPAFDLAVSPGDTHVGRGRWLTITVGLERRTKGVEFPTACTLVVLDDQNHETRLEMPAAKEAGHYSLRCKVPGDFYYRVEAADVASPTFRVCAVVPVELAADSPVLTVTPPEYARATLDEETLRGLVDVSCLQHSSVRFAFHFTRPAVAAALEWSETPSSRAADRTKTPPRVRRHPLPLAGDHRSATLTLPAAASGAYRLVTEAEHGIRTEYDGGTVTVKRDLPPALLKFHGKEELRAVRPSDRVPVEIRLADDIAVAEATLEYRVNGKKEIHEEVISLDGAGTREAVGRHALVLAGKAQAGDEVEYRVRIRDNLPAQFQGPHTVYYPPDRWLRLKVVNDTGPIQEAEILAQRDDVNRRLEAIQEALLKEKRGVYKVQQESRGRPRLDGDQLAEIKDLRRQNSESERALRKLTEELGEVPVLESLAEKSRQLADEELRRADSALEKASPRATEPEQRHANFERADRELAGALKKLDALKQANEKLAKSRLDRAKVEQLAERQRQLAEKAAELAARHPTADDGKKLAERLKREQADVAAELDRLTRERESLRKALEDARAEQARHAAERAKELAQRQRELTRAAEETEAKRRAERLANLARRQRELTRQTEKLGKETALAVRATGGRPPSTDEANRAANALKSGDADKAARHQQDAARELERFAGDLQRAVNFSTHPRDAARQLARMQDLREREANAREQADATKKPAGRTNETSPAAALPKKAQADQARQLAQEQRKLLEEARRAADAGRRESAQSSLPRDNPVAELAKEQAAIANESRKLADQVSEEHGDRSAAGKQAQDAHRAAEESAKAMQSGALEKARNGGDAAAKQLRDLSARLARTPSPQRETRGPDALQRARQLSRRQEEVNRRLKPLASDTNAQRAQQQAGQEQLGRDTQELRKQLSELQQQLAQPRAREQAGQAGRSAQQAQEAMQRALAQNQKGDSGQARRSREQAAEALDRAAQRASQAAQKSTQPGQSAGTPKPGVALQEARAEMNQAQAKMTAGQQRGAQASMQQAARALSQAAQQLAQQGKPAQATKGAPPSAAGRPPGGGVPDASDLGRLAATHAGKRWGDLPGELRTRIVQEMKARYGDDYGRMIKLYFEQLADTHKKK